MKHTLKSQAKRAGSGCVLATLVAVAGLGINTAQAQSFFKADLSINAYGFLDCSFRETDLAGGATVNYTCGATDIGWVTECFYKNRPVANGPVTLYVAHDQTTTRTLTANKQGTIMAGILTAYPTVEEEPHANPCADIAVGGRGNNEAEVTETITAIRWCNSSLVDTTNYITGAEEPELFELLEKGGSTAVPSCEVLQTLPTNLPIGTPL